VVSTPRSLGAFLVLALAASGCEWLAGINDRKVSDGSVLGRDASPNLGDAAGVGGSSGTGGIQGRDGGPLADAPAGGGGIAAGGTTGSGGVVTGGATSTGDAGSGGVAGTSDAGHADAGTGGIQARDGGPDLVDAPGAGGGSQTGGTTGTGGVVTGGVTGTGGVGIGDAGTGGVAGTDAAGTGDVATGGVAGTGGAVTGGVGTGGLGGGGMTGTGGTDAGGTNVGTDAGHVDPSSCAELRSANPTADDGIHTLYLGGRHDHPYQAYCADMTTAPLTYLTLLRVGGINNTSSYDATTIGTTTVVTTWSRVRFDPVAMAISPADFRFSQSTGFVTHESTTQVPYGVARDCSQTGTPLGVANVDLRGLPFATIPNWSLGGSAPLGTTTPSAFNQVVSITGGGSCGWNAPGADRLGGTPIPLLWCPAPSNEICDGLDNDCDGVIDNGCPADLAHPSSCAEYHAVNPTAADGEYTLYLQGSSDRPYQAYCTDMATTAPLTYLTLVRGGGITNTSSYDATTVGTTTVVTTWSRVRFDPVAIAISPADFRFSQSTGFVTHESTIQVPYGVARDCSQTGVPLGVANVDFRGLPFATIPNWSLGGFNPLGSTTMSAFNQVVSITGGGSCGWNAPGADRLGGTPIPLLWCPAPSNEICDGLDNDCDGVVDNGCP
jgi:GON domain/Putative metal-binding motif